MTHITYCERRIDDVRCRALAIVYAAGQWVCALHIPKAVPCSHSLSSDGRCSYCGGET